MMTEQETLHEMATHCAYLRRKRKCKHKFGSQACVNCKLYIANYSDADMRQLQLYMYSAECSARDWDDIRKLHNPLRNAVSDITYTLIGLFKAAVYIAIFGAIGYGLYYLWRHK